MADKPSFLAQLSLFLGVVATVSSTFAAEPVPAASVSAQASSSASAGPAEEAVKPDQVLTLLRQGNEAFVNGKPSHPRQDFGRLRAVAAGQKPVVTVLSCSDSRVPVELLFDQGIGDVFTVRVAGNVADTDELGTIEYGVDHLGTPVLVVLGHTRCGAVTAVATGAEVHGHIPELVDNIAPAVAAEKAKSPGADPKSLVEPAIVSNVYQSMSDVIVKSPLVRARLKAGKVRIVGGLYHLDDGKVEWLGEHPQQAELIKQGDSTKSPEHAPAKHEPAPAHEAPTHPAPHAEGATAEATPHDAGAPAGPGPNLPIAFAVIAAVACAAGALSMKLASKN